MTPAPVERKIFLQTLQASGLLTPKEFAQVQKTMPANAKVKSLARMLVDSGLVTKFQASQLLQARANGFFLGPYKILDQIGQGGMGRVYKALQQTMQRVVALKVLSPKLMQSPKVQTLFQREVQAAAKLNHPNIITAYDANQIHGRHYLAMEYVEGPNLDQLVRARGPLPVDLACDFLVQGALGLQHAHEVGMVHRDLKPANLLVLPGKRAAVVKILDFGLARLQEPSASVRVQNTIFVKENTVMGTPDYLSPEQARDLHQVDIRTDIYSLGCTLYFLLTGQPPFPGGSSIDKLVRHAKDMPKPVELFRSDIPMELAHLMTRLLAKRPQDRVQTPQELADVLSDYAIPGRITWDADAKDAGDLPPYGAEPAPPTLSETALQDPQLTPIVSESLELPPRRRRWPWVAGALAAAGTAGLAAWSLSGQ